MYLYFTDVTPISLIFVLILMLNADSSANEESNQDSGHFDVSKTLIWGPGLNPKIVVPVRYFYIQARDTSDRNYTQTLGENPFEVVVSQTNDARARIWTQVINVRGGLYVVRFRVHQSYTNLKVTVKYKGQHIKDSPYQLNGPIYAEKCYCPMSIDKWLSLMKCPRNYDQIKDDLRPFTSIDLEKVAEAAVSRFSKAGMHSLCHYKIIDNKIYRNTHGKHVGFKMFSDAILLSITRKVKLPDMEFFVNLGDWPLVKKNSKDDIIPMFSWCGSEETNDIVMPTYDITEATLEMMSRVTLDIISTQGNSGPDWDNKTEKAFWRGRDSRQERLDLVMMSRKNPSLIDAAMTHMFFFPKNPEKYGELVKSVSFFDFFKYKYQINLDGTVAAYRMPYLLAGDSLVLKQDSAYYEHFYRDMVPGVHYIPFKRDLSDLEQQIHWAIEHDEKSQLIGQNSRQFVRDHLMPDDIFCYHVKVLHEYSKLLKSKPLPADDRFELVEQPNDTDAQCDCKRLKKSKHTDREEL